MKFRILGSVELGTDDGEVLAVGGPRVRTLLAALLVHPNQTLRIDWLAEAVWDGQPPRTAAATLHSYVCRLRSRFAALGPDGADRILTDANGYRLRVDPGELDADVFGQHVDRGRAAAAEGRPEEGCRLLRTALAQWRGPALANITVKFARVFAVSLDEARASALAERLDLELGAGRHQEIIPELRLLTLRYPLRQRLVWLLMLALYRSGQPAEALHAFRVARHALVEELGVEPGPILQALHQQILNNDAELDRVRTAEPTGQRNLPPDIEDFAGRTEELHRLLDAGAADGTGRTAPLVNALNGMPGIGKTTLAVHVAHLLADHYPDGQLFLDLRGHHPGEPPRDPADALGALLQLLGVPERAVPATLEQRAAMWRTRLTHRRLVVVLDDAADAAQVEPLLPGDRGCLVLVTSRRRLDGLRTRHALTLEPLSSVDSCALLKRAVGERRAAAEPHAVQELAELCHHLPLALRAVAARLHHRPSWDIESLVQRVRDGGGVAELSAGELSLGAAFAESYRRLDSAQRRLVTLLSLQPANDFEVGAAAAAAALAPAAAERTLESLVDANMLELRGYGRYRMYPLMREYIRACGAGPDAGYVDESVRRVFDYYLHTIGNVYRALFPDGGAVDLGFPLPGVEPLAFRDGRTALRWYEAADGDRRIVADHPDGRPGQAHMLRTMSLLCARLGDRDLAVRLDDRAEAVARAARLPAVAA